MKLPATLRFRLTLVSTAVLGIVLSAFGGAVYILFNHTLHANLDATLLARATQALQEPYGSEYGANLTGTFVQFVNSSGQILNQSGFEVLPVTAQVQRLARGDDRGKRIFDTQIGKLPLRILVARVNDPSGNPLGAIMVAAPRSSIDMTLRRLRLLLLWAGVVGLGLAGSLSWKAARAALRPVEEVAGAAMAIGETGDLSRRVSPAGDDELGRLTLAFNGMLGQLEHAHAELERTLDSQRRFVADASHEIRTPLTTMRGNLEVLRKNPNMPRADRVAALTDAIEEGERMSRLVEDLLALARTDAVAQPVAETVAFDAVTREAVDIAASSDSAAGGDGPPVSIGAIEPVEVRGSADLLRRLVTNLVENAIKFTPATGRVGVSVHRENGWATLIVADTGIGMTEEELSHAFDRFWRSDAARAERGSGLGLAIAKAVVDEHGGQIAAQSVPGEGTTFTVRLPATAPGV